MKLNVGSGKDYREGYINLEKNHRFKADLYMDMMDYAPDYPEFDGFDEILAQDVIDHVTYVQVQELLKRFYNWLKVNGLLNIHLPNFTNISKWAAEGDHEAMTWIYGSDGDRAYYDTNFIKWGYTEKSIRELLEKTGFIVINIVEDCAGYGMRVMATKR